jgi:hypothetical protein
MFLALGIMAILIIIGTAFVSASQSTPDRFRELIEDLNGRSVTFTVYFAQPIATTERSRSFSDQTLRLGDDYFCFYELWNNQDRYHCVPYTNIVTITFVE